MIIEKICPDELFPKIPKGVYDSKLTLYIPELTEEVDTTIIRPCIVICPGGGYWWTSAREAEPVALRFASMGICAAVCDYSCGGSHYPTQLLQILGSITYLRRNADKYNIDKDKIAVMGFSAGGHAACSAGVFWDEDFVRETLDIESGEDKPNGMILGYPVITSGEYAHKDSFKVLLGEDAPEEMWEKVSLEKQINAKTPKTFIWHTAEDGLVPCENSLLLATALKKQGITFELHIYPYGHHGMSLCDYTTDKKENVDNNPNYAYNKEWFDDCIKWVRGVL